MQNMIDEFEEIVHHNKLKKTTTSKVHRSEAF